jgi:hypothetical protein
MLEKLGKRKPLMARRMNTKMHKTSMDVGVVKSPREVLGVSKAYWYMDDHPMSCEVWAK